MRKKKPDQSSPSRRSYWELDSDEEEDEDERETADQDQGDKKDEKGKQKDVGNDDGNEQDGSELATVIQRQEKALDKVKEEKNKKKKKKKKDKEEEGVDGRRNGNGKDSLPPTASFKKLKPLGSQLGVPVPAPNHQSSSQNSGWRHETGNSTLQTILTICTHLKKRSIGQEIENMTFENNNNNNNNNNNINSNNHNNKNKSKNEHDVDNYVPSRGSRLIGTITTTKDGKNSAKEDNHGQNRVLEVTPVLTILEALEVACIRHQIFPLETQRELLETYESVEMTHAMSSASAATSTSGKKSSPMFEKLNEIVESMDVDDKIRIVKEICKMLSELEPLHLREKSAEWSGRLLLLNLGRWQKVTSFRNVMKAKEIMSLFIENERDLRQEEEEGGGGGGGSKAKKKSKSPRNLKMDGGVGDKKSSSSNSSSASSPSTTAGETITTSKSTKKRHGYRSIFSTIKGKLTGRSEANHTTSSSSSSSTPASAPLRTKKRLSQMVLSKVDLSVQEYEAIMTQKPLRVSECIEKFGRPPPPPPPPPLEFAARPPGRRPKSLQVRSSSSRSHREGVETVDERPRSHSSQHE